MRMSKPGLVRCTTVWILITLFLQACVSSPPQQDTPTPEIEAPATTVILPSVTSTKTYTPTPSPEPTSTPIPSQTPTPTDVPASVLLRERLVKIIDGETWNQLGLSDVNISAWHDFAQNGGELSASEYNRLELFLEQWDNYERLMAQAPLPETARPALRLQRNEDEQGRETLALYAVDHKSDGDGNNERLFLLASDKEGQLVGLALAPYIEGLHQQISLDGRFVEYLDADGRWLLKADARKLDQSSDRHSDFKYLADESGIEWFYILESTYPRYYLNVPGVEAAFYALGNLTYNQILLLLSMLELFNQDELADLMPYVFSSGENVEYIISNDHHPIAAAMAWPLGGMPPQGIVMLFTKNLFGNRYDTASSLAHEAAHIWQGRMSACYSQADEDYILGREIGKGVVPDGFFEWTVDELYKAVRSGQIGAYHLSLWVLTKLNQTSHANWVRQVIQTGMANGQPLINCYP